MEMIFKWWFNLVLCKRDMVSVTMIRSPSAISAILSATILWRKKPFSEWILLLFGWEIYRYKVSECQMADSQLVKWINLPLVSGKVTNLEVELNYYNTTNISGLYTNTRQHSQERSQLFGNFCVYPSCVRKILKLPFFNVGHSQFKAIF